MTASISSPRGHSDSTSDFSFFWLAFHAADGGAASRNFLELIQDGKDSTRKELNCQRDSQAYGTHGSVNIAVQA